MMQVNNVVFEAGFFLYGQTSYTLLQVTPKVDIYSIQKLQTMGQNKKNWQIFIACHVTLDTFIILPHSWRQF